MPRGEPASLDFVLLSDEQAPISGPTTGEGMRMDGQAPPKRAAISHGAEVRAALLQAVASGSPAVWQRPDFRGSITPVFGGGADFVVLPQYFSLQQMAQQLDAALTFLSPDPACSGALSEAAGTARPAPSSTPDAPDAGQAG